MIKILKELSQVLEKNGILISASQEEKILIASKNLYTSLEVIEELEFHEPHLQEELEASIYHPFKFEEAKELWTTSDGDHPLELEIEEFLTFLSSIFPRTQGIDCL